MPLPFPTGNTGPKKSTPQPNIPTQPFSGGPGTQGQAQQAAGGGSDWQHLLFRTAEVILGSILVYIGVAGLVARTRPAKLAVNVVAGGVAGGTTQALRSRTRQTINKPAPRNGGNGS